jgi:hypothetical protein
MIAEHVGKAVENTYKKIDQAWESMLETASKLRKEALVKKQRNPEVHGNQTDAHLKLQANNEIKGIPEPSEKLASAAAERQLNGDWKKI